MFESIDGSSGNLFAGCSDDFLKDKKVYGSYDSSVVYENYETATSRVDYLYQCLLPSATGGSNALTDITSAGGDDDFSKCTEEYGGYSAFNNPSEILTIQTVPDYFTLSMVKRVLGDVSVNVMMSLRV